MNKNDEAGFAARIFGPKGTNPTKTYSPIPERVKSKLILLFKKELLKPQYNPVQILLTIKGYPDLIVSVEKLGHTAGVAQWIRNAKLINGKLSGGELEGVSLLLSGIDKNPDDQAIQLVESGRDECGKGLPVPSTIYNKIRMEVRPILVIIYWSVKSRNDPSLKFCAEALAQAFFDQFGAKGDKTDFEKLAE